MKPNTVIEAEIGTYTRFQLPHGLVAFQVDVLVLEAPPQTLHPDVVQCPPLSVHAHLNDPAVAVVWMVQENLPDS